MKPNVLLGVPAYGGNIHADFVHSLMGIEQARDAGLLDYSLMTITNESLITRARNTIISTFYNNPQFSHLFFIDADLGFPKETLPLLLKQNRSVIGVPVPLKGFDERGNRVFNVGTVLDNLDGEEIIEVNHIGNALLMLSRDAVKSLCDVSDQYAPSSLTRGHKQVEAQYDVFQVGVRDGVYLSEDFWVCSRLRELGYKIYVYPNISVRHNGNYVFTS